MKPLAARPRPPLGGLQGEKATKAVSQHAACAQPCISPLHTHFVNDLLHTEAKANQFNTLASSSFEWNVRLDRTCGGGYCKPAAPISGYVDGALYNGDPRAIKLEDKKEIAIVIGPPPATIPSAFPTG